MFHISRVAVRPAERLVPLLLICSDLACMTKYRSRLCKKWKLDKADVSGMSGTKNDYLHSMVMVVIKFLTEIQFFKSSLNTVVIYFIFLKIFINLWIFSTLLCLACHFLTFSLILLLNCKKWSTGSSFLSLHFKNSICYFTTIISMILFYQVFLSL